SIALPLRLSQARIASIVDALARRYDRPPVSATVTGADGAGPIFSPARPGLAVEQGRMRAALARALRDGGRRRLVLATRPVAPKRTVANYGPVIVISRGSN